MREELAAQPIPADGRPFGDVLAEFREKIAPYPFGNGHPRFLAWVNSPPHPAGIAADALAAAMNPSVAGGDHAAVHIEHQVVRWFADAAGFPAGSGGLLVSGGSTATLTALAVARHRAAARAGIDVRAAGLQGDARFAVYVGEEGHGSARKAVELLGLGSAWVRTVAVGGDFRMDPDHLRTLIAADRARGVHPVAVVASAGTTNTGAIDPLDEIADVCAELDVWLHVDGAYGLPALLFLDEYAHHRPGLSRVDSIAMDPHKWLYAPIDAGLVLLRDPALARDAFSLVPAYLRTDDEPWFSEFGFEQTRPFRALKIWFLLHHLGTRGYADLIRHDLAMADRLAAAVEADEDLELLARGLSVVCFRGRPAGVRLDELDAQNRRVLADVQRDAFLAGTTVNGVFGLRACVVNPGTTAADIDAVLELVRSAVRRGPAGPPA
ncbi:pyridoxal phosphate-dependent decarboxylase family protein [Hamadaea tsunoensis]|uniref:pyridoxal phosphate-dependent decarboxylase family protein n=1 Tax=Hamadaea tsunoensis TaxID=53368 RepID=UPI00146FC503|nr:pyridoxal-dependent decarboxylase [Hamadaea tsunoensis]